MSSMRSAGTFQAVVSEDLPAAPLPTDEILSNPAPVVYSSGELANQMFPAKIEEKSAAPKIEQKDLPKKEFLEDQQSTTPMYDKPVDKKEVDKKEKGNKLKIDIPKLKQQIVHTIVYYGTKSSLTNRKLIKEKKYFQFAKKVILDIVYNLALLSVMTIVGNRLKNPVQLTLLVLMFGFNSVGLPFVKIIFNLMKLILKMSSSMTVSIFFRKFKIHYAIKSCITGAIAFGTGSLIDFGLDKIQGLFK